MRSWMEAPCAHAKGKQILDRIWQYSSAYCFVGIFKRNGKGVRRAEPGNIYLRDSTRSQEKGTYMFRSEGIFWGQGLALATGWY